MRQPTATTQVLLIRGVNLPETAKETNYTISVVAHVVNGNKKPTPKLFGKDFD